MLDGSTNYYGLAVGWPGSRHLLNAFDSIWDFNCILGILFELKSSVNCQPNFNIIQLQFTAIVGLLPLNGVRKDLGSIKHASSQRYGN